ncbi:MAG: hypothetical protein HY074_04685 [Deltaproteobacteria bacterium]|nr:hypothetical protein [Deltaproteobacteria bacterium]
MIFLLCLLIVMSAALALGAATGKQAKKGKKAKTPRLPLVRVESLFSVNEAPVSKRAKIFLVAGSSQAASFAREVVEQKKLWLRAGFAEDEIECYYVKPLQEDLNDDQAQFVPVAASLARCHASSVKLLREHLKAVAERNPKPEFVYLYITSHGDKPVSYTLAEAKPTDEDYWALEREARYPVYEKYTMLIEGLSDGTATSTEILGALRAGRDARDLILTPDMLKEALSGGLAQVPKFVVLQGCFSGGFFEETAPQHSQDLLSQLPNITLLSAARHDRSSFGCEPGSSTTFFGGVYNALLAQHPADPREIAWKSLWMAAQADIAQLEKREKVSPPSLPQFYSNYR